LAVQNGQVWAWGENDHGELGDGTTTPSHAAPELIDPSDLVDIVAVSASYNSSFALSGDGSIWAWGSNPLGVLGIGDTSTSKYLTPQHLLPPAGYAFTSLETDEDGDHTLAMIAPVPVPEPAELAPFALCCFALLRLRRTHARCVE
jgi:alpha-tubulin suppressor-like RCC1 family protein